MRDTLTGPPGRPLYETGQLWWLLTDAGDPRVRVLDGGFAGWAAAGHPIETRASMSAARGGFVARPGQPDRVVVDQIAANPTAYTLVDVRADERYRGEVEPIDRVAGHIPGAGGRIDPGSWSDWIRDPARPVATGDETAAG